MSGRPSNSQWEYFYEPSSAIEYSYTPYTGQGSSNLSTPSTTQGCSTPASTQGHASPNSAEVPWSSTQLPEISSRGACQTGQYGTGHYGLHKTVSSGTDPKGNHFCNRDYGPGTYHSWHHSNKDGSYEYANPNGSKYYNSGNGVSKYTSPEGATWTKVGDVKVKESGRSGVKQEGSGAGGVKQESSGAGRVKEEGDSSSEAVTVHVGFAQTTFF